jgi:hypothetical protein
MLTSEVKRYYRQFRNDDGGIVGENAKWALRHAKTLATFRTLESQGLVRIVAEPETDNYFDVYGDLTENPRQLAELERTLELYGVRWVAADFFNPYTEEWETADSIGMCTGYSDPTSPFENCYVPQLMRSAIDRLVAETAERSDLAA